MFSKYYPLLFEPNLHTVIWGGDTITKWKGLPANEKPIGESWEVSAVPSSVNIISNGEYRGKDLVAFIDSNPEEILGSHVARQYHNQLPLLVKFIDARRDLSIQVHPNDEMAQRLHHKRGKSEMWYVLDAAPGSFLYAGFAKSLVSNGNGDVGANRETVINAYRRRVADGTIVDMLAKHEVKAGDVFYLPAGRVHAICGGILLAEIQQSSDVTYRIYDYNRLDMDGKPRELHTELAAEALDFSVEEGFRTQYNYEPERPNVLVDNASFTVRITETTSPYHFNLLEEDSFVIVMCLKGDCRIVVHGATEAVQLKEGYSAFIPAAVANYKIIPDNKDGFTKVLDAYVG